MKQTLLQRLPLTVASLALAFVLGTTGLALPSTVFAQGQGTITPNYKKVVLNELSAFLEQQAGKPVEVTWRVVE